MTRSVLTIATLAVCAVLASSHLAQAQINERCGAFAYAAKGAWGHATNAPTCEEAIRIAQKACRAMARSPDERDDCSEATQSRRDMWFLAMRCDHIVKGAGTVVTANTKISVLEGDIRYYALMNNQKPETCRRIILFHSDGRAHNF